MRFFQIWAVVAASLSFISVAQAQTNSLFITTDAPVRAPLGWDGYCLRYAPVCNTSILEARDVVLDTAAWNQLQAVNKRFNGSIKPMTDMDHWGVVEQWDYGDDGYGDCEDYVLAKRRELLRLGWPRQALLITVVRDQNGDGHAVLTVKSDRGEYVLDNQRPEIWLWSKTGYHFIKRQSQENPNVWIRLIDSAAAVVSVWH